MLLPHGTRLGPYEIVALLGSGGMGEVYRARDTRLDRTVAIKVLSPALAGAAAFRDRFDREARSIAALSHPNICTLHDVGRHDAIDFLVMEYLEGETLASRIARQPASAASKGARSGALPLAETLTIATSLAEALSAAHRAGIVHRDLKPGNVMLTKHGVKVLDFGLAKAGVTATPASGSSDSQTLTRPLTGAGTFVGTLPYMSPEQLEGREIDGRSDIFALGGIIYEMATGQRPFGGESQAGLVAAILERDPVPLATLQPATPPGLDRLVRKCLAKDRDARWQSASDVADELRWIASGSGVASSPATAQTPAVPSRTRAVWLAACAIAAIIAAGIAGAWMFRRDRTDPAVTAQHSQVTFDGRVLGAAISPDGRSIAFSAARGTDDVRVFVRDIAAGQALEIWKGISVQQLAWLADNARIAMSGGRPQSANLWIVPRFGGEPRALPFQSAFVSPSPDGSRLALSSYSSGGFRVISLDGEELSPVPQSLRNIRQIEWVAPDKVVALEVPPSGDSSVWAMTPRGENVRRVYFSADRMLGICASPATGAIYAIRQQQESADLLRIPDEGSSASPRVLATGLSLFETGFSIVNGCSVSTDGKRLVYRRGVQHANLWRLDLEGGNRAATQLTRGTAMLELPSISSDDRWIAATRGTGANAEIVKIPADGGEPTPIAAGRNPAWSPDGKRIAFISYRSGRATVWVITDQGLAAAEIPGSDVSNLHLIWMTDGRIAWPVAGARNYRIHDPASGRGENLLSDDQVRMGWLIRARLSPDGKRFAAYWNRKDGRGLWTIAWPGREARFLGDGLWPVGWSADGASIYAHKHGDGQMLRVSPETGRAEPVGRFEGTTLEGGCDMTADRRAMVCALLERSSDVWLIEHFDPEVTAKPKT